MNYTVYVSYDHELTKHNILIEDYPHQDVYLKNILPMIAIDIDLRNAVYDAIKAKDMKAIEGLFNDNSIIFPDMFRKMLLDEYDKLESEDILTPFQLEILHHPKVIIDRADAKIFYKYLDYRCIRPCDFYYMLYNDEETLISKLKIMLDQHFSYSSYPDTTNAREFIEIILGGHLNIKSMPTIIYTLINSKYKYNTLEEFLSNEKLDYKAEYLLYDIPYIEEFTIEDNTILFNTFYYKPGRIIKKPVKFTTDKHLICIFEEYCNIEGIFSLLNKSTPDKAIVTAICNKIYMNHIIELIGENKAMWKMLCKQIVRCGMSYWYTERNKNYILYITNHKYFIVDTNTIPEPYSYNKSIPDEIKLRSDKQLVACYMYSETNKDVFLFMLYSLLQDIFRTNKVYWRKLYKYNNIVNEYKDIIHDKQTSDQLFNILCQEEGIVDSTIHKIYNALTMLCIEYYIIRNDISNITNFKEYYNSVEVDCIIMNRNMLIDAILKR